MKIIRKLSWHQRILLKKELKKKCQSFHQQGYPSVNEAELMEYLICYRWKKQEMDSIKACREDILHIEINEFFDYQQLVAQTSTQKIKNWHDVEDLF